MTSEDRLDALLTARQRAERERRHDNADPTTGQHSLNGSVGQVWEAAGDAGLAPPPAGAPRPASPRLAPSPPAPRAPRARVLARGARAPPAEGGAVPEGAGAARAGPQTR